mgnify:CR=1 FL=1
MTEQFTGTAETAPRGVRRMVFHALAWCAACVVLPLLMLAGLELALLAANVGAPRTPFAKRTWRETTLHVRNPAFFGQFFQQARDEQSEDVVFAVPEKKAGDTYRIFVFGGSAAAGWPASGHGFASMLKLQLEAAYPAADFQVFNCANAGLNSHVMRATAAACVKLQPDLFIVYMGNNEFLGPFGRLAVGRFGSAPPAWLAAWMVRARGTRLAQLLASAAPGNGPRIYPDREPGVRQRTPGTPFVDRVRANFASNLEAICRAGRAAGADVLLSTVAVNLRDWPPEDSRHFKDLGQEERAEWETLFERGRKAQADGKYREALDAYTKALEIDDTYAELHYLAGECFHYYSEYDLAKKHFEQAAVYDNYTWARCKPFLRAF